MYIVVERYFNNGKTYAEIVKQEEFKKENYPENDKKYDQYFTECKTLKEAQQWKKDVYNA